MHTCAFWSLLEQFWASNGLLMLGARWMDEIEDQRRLGINNEMKK